MSKKQFAKISRWLHIYMSMISFVIVLFFSATGLTLNHADYFQSGATTTESKGKVDSSWVNSKDTLKIQKLALSEFFRSKYKVKGAVADFRIDDREVSFSYKGPGYQADVFVEKANGNYTISETSQGFMGFVNDLHKGRDTGKTWQWLIDISAILMVLISLTGLVLLLYIKKKRLAGIILAVVGFAIMYLLYHYWGQ